MPVVLALLVASAPAPLKLASAGFDGVGVDRTLLVVLGEQVAQRINASGVASVITPGDIATVLGLERQKQLLGCAEDSTSCMTELAGALGVRYLLAGDVARLGKRYTASLKVLDTASGRAVFSGEVRADGEEQLAQRLRTLADQVSTKLDALRPRTPEPPPPVVSPVNAPPAPVDAPAEVKLERRLSWAPAIPTAAGVIAAGMGAFFVVRAHQQLAELSALADNPVGADALARGTLLRDDGRRNELVGGLLLGVGAAALVGGITWWLLAPTTEVRVSVLPVPHGALLSLGGSL